MSKNDVLLAFIQQLKLQQKDVQLLGFMPKREFGFVYPFPFITEKDTNWYGKPGGGTSGYFTRTPFDIMINFHPEERMPWLKQLLLGKNRKILALFAQQVLIRIK